MFSNVPNTNDFTNVPNINDFTNDFANDHGLVGARWAMLSENKINYVQLLI